MSTESERSLLGQFGGDDGCRRLATAFYERVAGDEDLRPLFPGKSLRCATEEFSAFLIQFLEGDETKTQYRWWLSLRESHARFRISERQRIAWLTHMRAAISATIEGPELRDQLGKFFVMAASYIGGRPSGELPAGEWARRWDRQLELERFIDDLAHGRDSEAIALAEGFASRRSVLVGALARMIETGRESLVEFACLCIERDPELANRRFNGRTLMHFAAAAGCVPVVRVLLLAGVDPNVMDEGGHAALYRVGNGCAAEEGAEVVRALVAAGADVDHAGGVTKSTALHAAARHGHLPVARALLEARASVAKRDKKGFTPLDRAINCHRKEIVDLLRSDLVTADR